MTIQRISLYRYRLPLTAPLSLGPTTIRFREGALVRVETDRGYTGWGDVAPLPGFSTETLAEACRQIRDAAPNLVGRTLPMDWGRALPEMIAHPGGAPLAASVRFGMEQALAATIADRRDDSLAQVFSDAPRATVSLNALLTGSPAHVRAKARRVRTQGYRAAKLKVGRRDMDTEIAVVRSLYDLWDGTVALRLDANRAWALDEARAFAEGIAGIPIAYIEEPLADPRQLPELAATTALPIALDESMQDGTVQALADHSYARATVLKPTLMGGLWTAWQRAQEAQRLGMTPVLSAAYESGVGMQALVALAASLSDVPAGLDTYRQLAEDVVAPRLSIAGSAVERDAVLHARHAVRTDAVYHEATISA